MSIDLLLGDTRRSQREKLRLLASSTWRGELERLDDDALLEQLHAIVKAINSKKLRTELDALIGALRRDGAELGAPLPKPVRKPAPSGAEVAAGVEVEAEAPHNPELEARLRADPRDHDTALVYRDWLESRGLVRDGRVILGRLGECDDMLGELEWRDGFIRRARLSYSSERFNGQRPNVSIEQALGWLLDDPGPGRLIEQLVIGLACHDDNDYSGVCRVIGARPRPTLSRLEIGDFDSDECELNWSHIGVAAPMWPALTHLRALWLRAGSMDLTGIDLPALRELETVTGGMSAASLAAIATGNWPALERLTLQIGLGRQGATTDVDLVEPILTGERFPALVDLGLCNCEFTDELCRRLTTALIMKQLRRLDLSMGTMSLAGAQALASAPAAFARLESLCVDDNYLPAEARELLAGLGPAVEFGDQRDDRHGRYASAFE